MVLVKIQKAADDVLHVQDAVDVIMIHLEVFCAVLCEVTAVFGIQDVPVQAGSATQSEAEPLFVMRQLPTSESGLVPYLIFCILPYDARGVPSLTTLRVSGPPARPPPSV